ncbi:MAG: XRE family transcriptional regulator [Pseudomonadales bacterium]|nr:XRE family transcriptional regulator [Pseudomonadales bacterium]
MDPSDNDKKASSETQSEQSLPGSRRDESESKDKSSNYEPPTTPSDSRSKPQGQTSQGLPKNQDEHREGKRDEDESGIMNKLTGITSSAFRFAKKTTGTSWKVGKAIIKSQDQLKLMISAGESLRDIREVAGLTLSELSDALNLKDKTLLEAVENGTATLSFELILRLAALLARNDPIPFILRFTRTYNPEIWKVLHDWGLGRLPLQFERERKFINIYRSHDQARKLSDQGYERVLEFTRQAFELSLHFIAEQERVSADNDLTEDEKVAKEIRRQAEKARKQNKADRD